MSKILKITINGETYELGGGDTEELENAVAALEAAAEKLKGNGTNSVILNNPDSNTADGENAISGGTLCHANAKDSVSLGNKCSAEANGAFSHGYECHTHAKYAGAFGHTITIEDTAMGAHAFGQGLKANRVGQLLGGRWNKPNEKAAFIVGFGKSDTNRRNGLEVEIQNGVIYLVLDGVRLSSTDLSAMVSNLAKFAELQERFDLLESQHLVDYRGLSFEWKVWTEDVDYDENGNPIYRAHGYQTFKDGVLSLTFRAWDVCNNSEVTLSGLPAKTRIFAKWLPEGTNIDGAAIKTNDMVTFDTAEGKLKIDFPSNSDDFTAQIILYKTNLESGVKFITFTINGDECYAEEGMTLTEWCDSKYNTGGWVCSGEYNEDTAPYYITMGGDGNPIITEGEEFFTD